MGARSWVERVILLLPLFLSLFLFPTSRVGAWEDREENRWEEESERINGIEFDEEGNWRTHENDRTPHGFPADEERAWIQELRTEAERRERAYWLARKHRARQIEKKWGTVRESSPTVYVDYTKSNDAFNRSSGTWRSTDPSREKTRGRGSSLLTSRDPDMSTFACQMAPPLALLLQVTR